MDTTITGNVEFSKPVLRNRVADRVAERLHSSTPHCLDIGAGTGSLLDAIAERVPDVSTAACDYTTELMRRPGQAVDIADLNHDSLPYADSAFDAVTCTEVVEHLENYRHLVREVYRVSAPGGIAVFTTPNVLNVQSRFRFLFFGFWNLFGPLPVARDESYSTVGHITPVPYFYLAHALAESGFSDIEVDVDKYQRSGMLKLAFSWPFIALFGWLAARREARKWKTIDDSNARFVRAINSLDLLLGRTIIVTARKPQ